MKLKSKGIYICANNINTKLKIAKNKHYLGYALLYYALQKEYGISIAYQEIKYGFYGKPFLKNYKTIFFNISNSSSMTVCVIDDSPIGIDIQEYINFNQDIAAKYFCYHQNRKLIKTLNTKYYFTKYWTILEALGKYHGLGIIPMNDYSNLGGSVKLSYFIKKDFFITVCSRFKEYDRIIHVGEKDLIDCIKNNKLKI